MGLPKHDVYKDYTIVTTSRPWKIHALRIRDTEIQKMLKLKGFDDDSECEMIRRTVFNLSSRKGEWKEIDDCRGKLEENALRSLKQVPLMLQQLICLWFDGKLDKTTRYDVNTEMLELFFTWNDDRTIGTNSKNTKGAKNIELPECFADKDLCEMNSHLIYEMQRLAYETLFNCPKDKSLTFDVSLFRKLKISDEIRESCLNLGILTHDKCPSLSVSKRPKSMFSFIQKSVQEFLTAVNIAINCTKINSSGRLRKKDLEEVGTQFINDVFQNCSTVNNILEQSNVIIMLCGLEPRIAAHVSRYIYCIVKEDPLVQRYKKTIDSDIRFYSDNSCINDIQDLIFDSMKESNICIVEHSPTFYIGDIYIDHSLKYCDIVCSGIDHQLITPDSVHSVIVYDINTINVKFSKYLPKFKHLEKIKIKYDTLRSPSTENLDHMIEEVNKSIAEVIKINTSTLKSLSLDRSLYTDRLCSLFKMVVCILPSITNLVAINMTDITISHNDTCKFCEFLETTCYLEQIYIYVKCKCENQHDIDLSKHQQLQYLHFYGSICVTDFYVSKLEIFKCRNIRSTNFIKIFDSIRKCNELNELELFVDDNYKYQPLHVNITERLVSVLPLLHNLRELKLDMFRLTDNIIQVPSQMKNLKSICLIYVTMSLTTWRKFVDCLLSVPHTVKVESLDCFIMEDGDEFNDDKLSLILGKGENGNDARQYVKDLKHLFIVESDGTDFVMFSTTTKNERDKIKIE